MADFIDPNQVIGRLQLKDGMRVADFGAGSGFYSFAAARRVGSRGRVYAIEVQKDLLEKLQVQAQKEHASNVQGIWGDLDEVGGTRLADASQDAVIISNVLFQSENKDVLASEAARVLKPGGQVLLVDWSDSYGNLGPHPDQVVPEETAVAYFTTAGLSWSEGFSAGAHHYGHVFRKNS